MSQPARRGPRRQNKTKPNEMALPTPLCGGFAQPTLQSGTGGVEVDATMDFSRGKFWEATSTGWIAAGGMDPKGPEAPEAGAPHGLAPPSLLRLLNLGLRPMMVMERRAEGLGWVVLPSTTR